MKPFALAVLLLAAALPSTAGVFPYEVHRETLPNGLKLLLIPMESEGLVSYWTVVRTGSRDEVEEGVTGFAHFFEHMMFRGSENYSAAEWERLVATMGADSNAFTSTDITAYYLSLTREDLPLAIELESDRFQHLKYAEPEFRTEAGAVYGEYRKNRTNPWFVFYEAMQGAAFDTHTYRHTTMGFEADVARMPEQYEYSLSFFDRFYRPENVVVMVIGDFDLPSTRALLAEKYGPWKEGYQAAEVPVEPAQTAPRRIDVPFEGQTLPTVSVAWKGDRFLPEDPVMVAATLLGDLAFGETSALNKKLVLDERRVQRLNPDFGYSRDPNLWDVTATVNDAADLAAVEAEIWATVERFQDREVTPGELADAISRRKYGFLSSLTTPQAVAGNLARIVAITGDVTAIEELASTYDRVTPEHVREAARRYLTRERSTVGVLHSADQPIPEPQAAEEPVLMPVAKDPNVVVELWFRVGSQDDPPGKEGLASLTADLLTDGGTARRSFEEVLAELSPLAARWSASVDKEQTVLTGVVHRDLVGPFYSLMTEALLQPGFREEDFERLRTQTVAFLEKRMRYSSDEELGKEVLQGTVFEGTPYGHHVAGTVESLRSLTLDDVRDFYRTHFTRDNVVIGLAGAYEEGLPSRLLADLARLPEGRPETTPAPEPRAIDGRNVVLVEKPGSQSTAISFGYPLDLHRGEPDFYALWLVNSWLGEHRNSVARLYQVIREQRGMNYGDYSYLEAFPWGGYRNMPPTGVSRRQQLFEVWIRPVRNDNALFALRAALREIDRLIESGLTPEQFEAHRDFLRKYSLQFATTTAERLGYRIDDRFYDIEGEGHLARFRERMDELTVDEVNAAIRKYLRTDDLEIVMVVDDAKAVQDALVSDRPSPIDYAGVEKPAELLAADAEIESYPLGIEAEKVTVLPVDEVFER